MYKRCKPPSKEKWTSASHDLVTCGKKCWTSTKEALPAAIARTHWIASCVRPVKPQSPNAARANVVHQALLAIQAKTAKTVTPELMASQADQVKMPNQMIAFSRYRPNATATLHQAAQANQDQPDQSEPQEMPEHQVVTVNQEPKDHQAHQAQLAKLEPTDPKDQPAMPEYKRKEPRDQPAHSANPVHQAPQDQRDQPVAQAKMAVQAQLDPTATLAAQAPLANQVPQVPQEKMVPQVPLALATTAHQLVWLQVIKHNSSGNSNIVTTTSSISNNSVNFMEKNFVPTLFLFHLNNIVSHQ
jgi:hypothetical protein